MTQSLFSSRIDTTSVLFNQSVCGKLPEVPLTMREKREMIIAEFIETEKNYVAHLKIIEEVSMTSYLSGLKYGGISEHPPH